MSLNRREFFRRAVGASAAGAVVGAASVGSATAPDPPQHEEWSTQKFIQFNEPITAMEQHRGELFVCAGSSMYVIRPR